MNYQEKKQLRIQRAREMAERKKAEAQQAFEQSRRITEHIPMGQPILVGHHSEKRHRRDLERSDNAMRKAVEADNKAAYYAAKAKAIENNTAISSDDENAKDLIQGKIDKLEKQLNLYKDINRIVKNKDTDDQKVTSLIAIGIKEQTSKLLLDKTNFGGAGIPSFKITNTSAEIRRLKKRLEDLKAKDGIDESDTPFDGGYITPSVAENRVQIFYDSKPDFETIKTLKKNGFKWSPSRGCWQRPLSSQSIHLAKFITNVTK